MVTTLTAIHIVTGSLACLGMLVAWLTKKGHVLHRRGGQLFVAAMSASLATAVVVALWRNNHFLLLIALFSGYFVYTGARLALVRDGRRSRLDQIITLAMLAVVVCMTALAFTQWQSGDSLYVATAVFIVIAALPAASDYRAGAWPRGNERIAGHVIRMGGASIATLTAVFVVNIETDPAFLAWIAPSVVLSPAIAWQIRRLRRA